MTSIQVPKDIKEQVQAFSVALAWENKQLSRENKMIDPSKITKVDVLKLERTSPELYHCIRLWKDGQLTWEQTCNAAIILLLEQNNVLRNELIDLHSRTSPVISVSKGDPLYDSVNALLIERSTKGKYKECTKG